MLFRNVALVSLALVAAASAADTNPAPNHVASLLSQRRLKEAKKNKAATTMNKDSLLLNKKTPTTAATTVNKDSLKLNNMVGKPVLGQGTVTSLSGTIGNGENISGTMTGTGPQGPIDPNRESEDGAGEEEGTVPACDLGTVVDLALGDMENFSSLVGALQAANFVDILKGDGPFTVFAPTNAAFDTLPDGTLESLFEEDGVPTLSNILLYHVVSGKVTSTDLSDGMMAETVEGSDVEISIDGTTVMVNGATVTTADVMACNGVIHVIDSVLIPPEDDEGVDDMGEEEDANVVIVGPTGGAGGNSGGNLQSLTGCAGDVPSLLANGESPIDTPKRCLADCDCEDGCCVAYWGGFCTPQDAENSMRSSFGGGYLYCTSAVRPNQ